MMRKNCRKNAYDIISLWERLNINIRRYYVMFESKISSIIIITIIIIQIKLYTLHLY